MTIMMYGSWDMEHKTEHVVILDCFLLFYPINNLQKQNFENMKKTPEILSCYTCVP